MGWRKILVVLLPAALVIGGVIWLAGSGPENPHWTLPDGSKLELVKVSYGAGTHQAREGNRLRDYFYPILPTKLQERFGLYVATFYTTDPCAIVLWFRQTKDNLPIRGGAVELAALDRNGLEGRDGFLELPGLGRRILTVISPGILPVKPDPVYALELDNYPRRSRDLSVRVYYRALDGKPEKVGEFTIANRVRVSTPGWQPETLPATRKTNSLEIKLVQLQTGLTGSSSRFEAAGLNEIGTVSRAVFEFRENDRVPTNWIISDIDLSAATDVGVDAGNRIEWWERGKGFFDFIGTLWPEEPAWKLKVHLVQIAGFAEDELWVVKGVRVPGKGETVEIHAVTNIAGMQLELADMRRGAAGEAVGTVKISPILPNLSRSSLFRVAGIKDEQGRGVRNGIYTLANSGPDNSFGFQANDLGEAKSVDITFAIPKSIYVEFLAKPVLAAPATNR